MMHQWDGIIAPLATNFQRIHLMKWSSCTQLEIHMVHHSLKLCLLIALEVFCLHIRHLKLQPTRIFEGCFACQVFAIFPLLDRIHDGNLRLARMQECIARWWDFKRNRFRPVFDICCVQVLEKTKYASEEFRLSQVIKTLSWWFACNPSFPKQAS